MALALTSLANTYVTEEGGIEQAERLTEQALAAAQRSRSEEALLRARSATASVAYRRGDYEQAYETWSECAARETPQDGAEHQAFALDALAQIGDWPRYRKTLERFARRAQRADAQFEFVEKLYLSALTWLGRGRAAAAGTVLAYGVLLAFEAASSRFGAAGRTLSTADREQAMVRTAGAMGSARAVFVLLGLPDRQVARVRRAYERTIRKAAGADGELLIETVDSQILRPDDGEDAP